MLFQARYPDVGSVIATDADGDKILYANVDKHPCCVVVPQTGHVVVLQVGKSAPNRSIFRVDNVIDGANDYPQEIANETVLRVGAHEAKAPSREASRPAVVVIRRTSDLENEILKRRRDKRRVTRAVRPTKRVEFTEKDGSTEGKIVFQLEKESEHETFR